MITLNFEGRTSEDYRFTTTDKNCPEVLSLKAMVAARNAEIRRMARHFGKTYTAQLQRVTLMARGPRRDADGKRLHSGSDCCLRHEFATHWDVYMADDTNGMHILNEELATGLTGAEQRKLANLKHDMLMLEWVGRDRLRDK